MKDGLRVTLNFLFAERIRVWKFGFNRSLYFYLRHLRIAARIREEFRTIVLSGSKVNFSAFGRGIVWVVGT